MKIALNLLSIGPRAGGVGRHAAELPGALRNADPALLLTVLATRDLPPMPWEDGLKTVRLPIAAGGRASTALQLAGLSAVGALGRFDLVHSIANVGPPRLPGVPSVVTVHDLIWLHAGTDWGTAAAVAAMRRVALRSARWATRIQTPSSATATDLAEVTGIPLERIDVIPHGVHAEHGRALPEHEVRRELDLGEGPVVLAVAQKRPYKNLGAAIRGLAAVPEALLVLPGASTPHEGELRALAQKLGVSGRVRFVDWVEDDALEGLYRLAACVVVPSLYEGFGLPVLEAMARGAPVVCADAGSLPEVAGDAALLFDPSDADSLGAALARVLRDGELRARLVDAGRRRAESFTWERCARATLASYERALATSWRR